MFKPQSKQRSNTRSLLLAGALCCGLSAQALPIITDVVETNGVNEPTDTILAKWTGVTFNRTIANEPDAGAVGTPFTVPFFGEEVPSFVDRNHQWTGATPDLLIPRYLLGGEYIMSGNDNRDRVGYQLDVTISEKSFVYMLVDDRLADRSNANPPNHPDWTIDFNGDGLPDMGWIITDGWVPVKTGHNRFGNPDWPDHIGMDEGADGAGPGQGVNQWASIYTKTFNAGTFSIFAPDNGGQNMYGVVVVPFPKKPTVTGSRGNMFGFSFSILDGSETKVKADSVTVTLDGMPVTVNTTKANDVTTVSYAATPPFAPEANHTAVLSFSDDGSPEEPFTETLVFTVAYYATLTADMAVPASEVDLASPGFTVRVAQAKDNVSWPSVDLPQNIWRAENQLAGRLIDPVTGTPFANVAMAGPHTASIINFNQELNDGGNFVEIGNFTSLTTPAYPDVPIPGIGAIDLETGLNNRDNIAAEITGYLELPAGLLQLGVNSDDGFLLTASRNPRDATGTLLGFFNAGRGSADSTFYVDVKEAGLYPVRLVWFEGGGGANVEFFSLQGTTKIPINAGVPGAIKAYSRAAASATLPPAVSVTPVPRQANVAGSVEIVATLTDGTTQVQQNSVTLSLDGDPVQAQTSKSGSITTVRYDPPGLMAPGNHEVVLSYSDGGAAARTNTWTFTVADWTAYPVIPASFAVPASSINLNNEGFLADVYQMPVARTGFPSANDVGAAERQLARGYIDPSTGEPYMHQGFPGSEPDGRHQVSILNWEQSAGSAGNFNAGNGHQDTEIVGATFSPDHVVAELITYLELKAGVYRFGVNADDGFKVTTSLDPRDQLPLLLGLRTPGGGAADVMFNFVVEQDGFYPFRLLWWEGTGGASLEFFIEDLVTGSRALINDRTRAVAPKAYRTYTGPGRPYVRNVAPAIDAASVFADTPLSFVLANAGSSPIAMWLNNEEVQPQITGTTDKTVSYQPSALLPAGSTNTVTVAYAGITNRWQFVVQNYPTIPMSQRLPLDAIDTSGPGLLAKVVQAKNFDAVFNPLTLPNSTQRAEDQLAGVLIDPDTQQPYVNEAIAGPLTGGRYVVSNFVNWAQSPGAELEEGNFIAPAYPDQPVPGIPGTSFHTDNIAAEIVAWIELPAGLVKMGVNSDDGFRVTLATNATANAFELGVFEGGRSATDTVFSFLVPATGLYPVRLIWYEGNGGASVEFFSVDAGGQKVLINDRSKPTALRAWYKVLAVTPPPFITGASLSGGNVVVEWSNGGTLYSAPAPAGPWTTTGDSDGSFSEPAVGTKFYRVER